MLESNNIINKLIERYDYGGAYDLLVQVNLEETSAGKIMNSCRYAINFDFKTAQYHISELEEMVAEEKIIREVKDNLSDLIRGVPDAIFSELLENIKIQIVNEEFIDFLGRVYRFKEAIYKYMFLSAQEPDRKFSFANDRVLKKNILKILKKKFRIYSNSTIYGISRYIQKYQKSQYNFIQTDKMLSSQKMMDLIELRHSSIIGHGFVGVSIDDIYKIYGNPYNVIDDFEECLEKLDIKIFKYKYASLNELLFRLIDEMEGSENNEE